MIAGAAPVSIGLNAKTPVDDVRALAPRVERLGFRTLWVNDLPGTDSLSALRAAAAATTTLEVATGVIPLDRRPADTLDLDGIPAERLTLGIGSGSAPTGQLALVRSGIGALRARTDARIVVGALGPKMRRLSAIDADGVLLNWLTPATAAGAVAELHRDALEARLESGESDDEERAVRGILYVRTIVDETARPALEAEAAGYERVPAYAANFERLGIRAIDATISEASALDAYRDTVDEVVLRAITPGGTLAELEDFVERAAEWLA
ncbi:LLM class flavin-dependent oxidoreductase [Agromyces protaetiae]|uniref:LLM class flavin-dependent oxidoreductase n=1 Tax=Agromyces protaetiae TaxID=2509455 RepID=A0A4P6FQT2_9MICO|nr:LLM class flavin-dependent oxidoreductase [Agromyces protaetiae]QAY72888.1 LLM class flavin-dependent oxidoreductase [Agromyces protaetiae]